MTRGPGARRAPSLAVVALLGTVAAGLLPAAPAAAQESYPLTVDGLPLVGHGYGHGRGMGQYGAQGAALRGLSYGQVLDFYYPGTVPGPLPEPARIRVRIDEVTEDDVVVLPQAGLVVADADGRRWTLPGGPERWRAVADPAGAQHVQQLVAGRWLPWDRAGGGAFVRVRFEAPGPVRVALPDGTSRAFRGAVVAGRGTGTALTTVNDVGFEDYLRSVVPSESPPSFHEQALRAQTVAARTYAAWKRAAAPAGESDVCSTTACQVYRGATTYDAAGRATPVEHARTDAAVADTAGEVRLHAGRLALTEFTSSTGGHTAAGGLPYLVAQPDPYDDFSGNPVHTWRTVLTAAAVAEAYPQIGTPTRVRVLARDARSQRTTSVALDGTAGSVTVTGDALRSRLRLREAWWAVDLGLIQLHWRELGGSTGLLGAPLTDEYAVAGGRAQDYRGGRVLWSPATGAHEVHGLIRERYERADGPAGFLGLPTSDELAVPGGRASEFTGGRVSWSAATGARETHGLILAHYLALGGPARWGLPTTDELAVPGGRASTFAGAQFYWSPGTGAREVHGAILARYLELGGPSSGLGLPTSDEQAVPGGARSDFTGGSLVWQAATGAVSLVAR